MGKPRKYGPRKYVRKKPRPEWPRTWKRGRFFITRTSRECFLVTINRFSATGRDTLTATRSMEDAEAAVARYASLPPAPPRQPTSPPQTKHERANGASIAKIRRNIFEGPRPPDPENAVRGWLSAPLGGGSLAGLSCSGRRKAGRS